MANLKNVIYLSNEDYETLVSTGTVTIDGETLTYDENNIYVTPDKLASTTEDGLMSSSDKVKLDSLPTFGTAASKDFTTSVTNGSSDLVTSGAVYTAIDNLPEPMIYKGTLGTGGTITSLPTASSANEGFTYKVITDGTYDSQSAKVGDVFISNGSAWTLVPSGDDAGEDTVRQINVNGTELLGTSISTGYVNFKNGSNVTISGSGHDITINATDTTYSDATTSASGLMSASDKTKLNSIANGAEVNVQSDWSVTDSSSDAFIKNKPTIPDTSNLVPYSGATSNVDLGNNVLLGVGVATKYGGVTTYISGEHISGGIGGTSYVVSNGDISRLIDPSDTPTNTTLYNFPIITGGTSENPTVKTVATTDAIPTTYIKSASSSGNTLTLTKQDNTTTTFTPTFSDTGATSIETTGSGNAVTTASYDSTTRKITLTKGSTFLTSESHVGDVVSVGATSGSHIAIGGTTANPTVGVASGYSIPSTSDQSTWSGKQDALSTQTAYTSKGSETKVPQITTNTLGQVTNITEVTITDNNDNQKVTAKLSGSNVDFGANSTVEIKAGSNITVTPNTSDNTITIASTSSSPTTYLKSASTSGNTLTLTKQDNTTITYTPSFTDTNYYPSRSYTSGLQISTSQGVSNTCALYVPNATTTQSGVVTTGLQKFAGRKTFTEVSIADSEVTDEFINIYSADNICFWSSNYNATWVLDFDASKVGFTDDSGTEYEYTFPSKTGNIALTSDIVNVGILDLRS